ncbi:PEP-CTERM sorting domain-containing protein [Hahella sp. CR1]|uniref:PEP-CTERM sorting domain-containing protein n=1 Tax=Hahella sp. CR1 TaxID=2992807 RepID=UPI00244306FA|nr:PEP-CTERM sorting domain-containing protein [Hahella sp. CR1]MDG9671378.1 PEP-CTERM sorting domain-containing protein [Hahella sp. CR1]
MKVVKSTFAVLLVLLSTSAYSLTINENDAININGSESMVYTHDQSTLTAMPDSDISWLYAYDNSTININGGETSWLFGYHNSTINISAGDISWLKVFNNSETNITYLDNLSWLEVYNDAVVNIYGSNFSYSNSHLSGNWANGNSFSFWALGNIDNIVLHAVPEPSTFALLVLGMGLLVRNRKI